MHKSVRYKNTLYTVIQPIYPNNLFNGVIVIIQICIVVGVVVCLFVVIIVVVVVVIIGQTSFHARTYPTPLIGRPWFLKWYSLDD